jgi:uncharacterized protein (TIGR01777 family)
MKIAIAGGNGFVGTALTKEWSATKHDLYILTRNPKQPYSPDGISYVQWLKDGAKPEFELEGIDVFINLAGESLNSERWTSEQKRRIVESRIKTTQEMNRILATLNKKPEVVINASAVGFYGTSDQAVFSETSPSIGDDFLSNTVKLWENEAQKAHSYCNRVIFTRFGVILGVNEGALQMMTLPYKLYAGGTLGSGKQWLSWIHVQDVARAIIYCIEHKEISGPVNFTAPLPVRMKEFGTTIASVMHRPHWFPVPNFILKTALGEMSMLVTKGQKALPETLIQHHYPFLFSNLKSALEDILK